MAVISLPHPYPLHPGHLFLPLMTLATPKSMAWLNSLSMHHREPVSGSTALSFGSCGIHPCPPLSQEELIQQWHLVSARFLTPVSSDRFGPVPRQQPGLQKNVNIKCYRTKAQHSLICNAFCMKCPFSRVCHWGWKCSVSLRNLVLLHLCLAP